MMEKLGGFPSFSFPVIFARTVGGTLGNFFLNRAWRPVLVIDLGLDPCWVPYLSFNPAEFLIKLPHYFHISAGGGCKLRYFIINIFNENGSTCRTAANVFKNVQNRQSTKYSSPEESAALQSGKVWLTSCMQLHSSCNNQLYINTVCVQLIM